MKSLSMILIGGKRYAINQEMFYVYDLFFSTLVASFLNQKE